MILIQLLAQRRVNGFCIGCVGSTWKTNTVAEIEAENANSLIDQILGNAEPAPSQADRLPTIISVNTFAREIASHP